MPTSPHRPSLASMLDASVRVWTVPSVATFTRLADPARGSVRLVDATRYVALAALLAGLLAIPRGSEAALGAFLFGLLGFATFSWFLHRLTLAGTRATGRTGGLPELAYVLALVWAPIIAFASFLVTLFTWVGLGPWLVPIVHIASVAAGVALSFLALRAIVLGPPVAIVVVLLVSAGATVGVHRLLGILVGTA